MEILTEKKIREFNSFLESSEGFGDGPIIRFDDIDLTIQTAKWERPSGFVFFIQIYMKEKLILRKSHHSKRGEVLFYSVNMIHDGLVGREVNCGISKESFIERLLLLSEKSRELSDFLVWTNFCGI
jgi:hypothetical protein